jgi:hypothetical protein
VRRLAALLATTAVLAALGAGATPASACPQPQEGPPCCPDSSLYTVDAAGHTVRVPNPLWRPCG